MSHEVETMAYKVETPWHSLGTRFKADVTPAEMAKLAGLDWEVRREPIYCKVDGREVRIPGKRAIVRSSDDKVLTVCSQEWKPMQNSEMLGFFTDYAAAGGAVLDTAGSLRGGNVVWALASLKDGFSVGGRDRVNGYLLFTCPHKVGAAITVRTTTVRVVCANTMAMAEAGGGLNYKQTHQNKFNFNKAREAVEKAHEGLAAAAKRAETLHRLKLSLADRTGFLAQFFGGADEEGRMLAEADLPKKLQDVQVSIENGPGAEPETAWGTLQGVLHWADHVQGRNPSARLFNSWMGDVAKLKIDVEQSLYEMAS